MAFVVGSVLIGGASSLIGAGIASKGAKDAAKTAAAGSDRAIDFQRESRDIALDLGSPYREAGYSALDKLGSMTGLIESGGSFGRPSYQGEGAAVTGQGTPWGDSPWKLGYDNGQYTATLNDQKMFWDDSSNQWMSSTGSAYGGSSSGKGSRPVWRQGGDAGDWVQGRAHGGVMYNVNELGPEDVYSKGAMTRTSNPKTMPPDPTGYVHPNIQGRAIGGTMIDPNSMGDSVGGYDGSGINWRSGVGAKDINWDGTIGGVSGSVNKGGQFGWRDGIPGQTQPGAVRDIPVGGLYDNINPGRQYGDPNYQGNPLHKRFLTGGNDTATTPVPQENPYDFTTDPGYQFRLNEGMRALESSAAARGGLLSGGFGRKAIRYGQDYASNEFSNIYNRISNIAGLGQVSAGQGGVFAQNAGGQMGNAAQSGALSSAYGQMGSTNAWSNAFNQIAQLPWDQIQWGGGNNKTGGLPGGGGFN